MKINKVLTRTVATVMIGTAVFVDTGKADEQVHQRIDVPQEGIHAVFSATASNVVSANWSVIP